jgi:hypothetical protein
MLKTNHREAININVRKELEGEINDLCQSTLLIFPSTYSN